MGYNIPLIRKVRDYLREHPEEHNQCYWAYQSGCKTTMCLAGTACHLSGHELDWETRHDYEYDISWLVASMTVEGQSIPDLARRLLGFSYDEADKIFYTYNEDRVLEILDCIIETAEKEDLPA